MQTRKLLLHEFSLYNSIAWLDLGVKKARIQGSFQLMLVQIPPNEHKLIDALLAIFPRLPDALLTGTELPHVVHALEHGPANNNCAPTASTVQLNCDSIWSSSVIV